MFISRHGPPAAILEAWDHEAFELLVSPPILAEYRRVLRYEKFQRYLRFAEESDAVVERFERAATLVTPSQTVHAVVDDPTDNIFLECAITGGAHYVVSGDAHILTLGDYEGIAILRAADFVREVLG